MAIVKKKLGNNFAVIEKKFRENFTAGLGGIQFDAFCVGWREGWQEAKVQLQAGFDAVKKDGE